MSKKRKCTGACDECLEFWGCPDADTDADTDTGDDADTDADAPVVCAEERIIGYDENGEPITCGYELPLPKCDADSMKFVAGYDANGDPITIGYKLPLPKVCHE
jgi:hypothetical protein